MREKLNPSIERQRHFHAFEVWRDMGVERTYRAVAREVKASPGSVLKWANLYKWKERLNQHSKTVAKRLERAILMKVDDPISQKLVDSMNQAETIIDSVFIKETDGNLIPLIKPKSK